MVMMIKDVVLNLSIKQTYDAAAEYAIAVAGEFDAHLAGIAFAYEPVLPATVMGGIPSDFIDAQRIENENAANGVVEKFKTAATRAGISAESRTLGSSVAGAADTFGRMARRFDLAIVGQAEPNQTAAEDLIAEAAMFQSGRPVIVVPYIHKGGLKLDRVLVCWDGSRAAARAIGDAIPVLERAKAVDVVMVLGEEGKRDQIPGADMGHHLACHRINVDVKRIVAQGEVQSTLLSYAADVSADLIVMGAYGHSRL